MTAPRRKFLEVMKANYNRKQNKGLKEYKREYIENRITKDSLIWIFAIVVYITLFIIDILIEERQNKEIWTPDILEMLVWGGAFIYYAFFSGTKPRLLGKLIIITFALFPVYSLFLDEKPTKLALLISFCISFVYFIYCYLKYGKAYTGINGVLMISGILSIVGVYDYSYATGYSCKFMFVSVALTVITTGVLVALLAKHRIPEEAANKSSDKIIVIVLTVIISLTLSYSACAHLNYVFDNNPTVPTQIVIKDKDIISGARSFKRYVFYSTIDGKEYEFDVDYDEYNNHKKGDIYQAEKCQGAFNEEYYH